MILKQIKGKSQKTGNDYIAYQWIIGDWKSNYFFFRGDIEKKYVLDQLANEGIEYDGE